MIRHWKSKPYYQHQNFAEHRWGHVKSNLEWLMAFLDVDPDCWLLALNYVCSVMNLTAEKILGWRTPQEVATGETPDICILLYFMFWDAVHCARHANKQLGSQKGLVWFGKSPAGVEQRAVVIGTIALPSTPSTAKHPFLDVRAWQLLS